jgi:hypothetical protein
MLFPPIRLQAVACLGKAPASNKEQERKQNVKDVNHRKQAQFRARHLDDKNLALKMVLRPKNFC